MLGDALLLDEATKARPTRNQLGTINGCYIPCLLNILGAPLFLFVGFAVGMMGWLGALGLFCFAETIAYLTITSFSALVTNGRMRGGGAYYMISRSLGPAFGGSSGLLFWITYCINVTFNTRAFTDTVFQTFLPHVADVEANGQNFWCRRVTRAPSAACCLLPAVTHRSIVGCRYRYDRVQQLDKQIKQMKAHVEGCLKSLVEMCYSGAQPHHASLCSRLLTIVFTPASRLCSHP